MPDVVAATETGELTGPDEVWTVVAGTKEFVDPLALRGAGKTMPLERRSGQNGGHAIDAPRYAVEVEASRRTRGVEETPAEGLVTVSTAAQLSPELHSAASEGVLNASHSPSAVANVLLHGTPPSRTRVSPVNDATCARIAMMVGPLKVIENCGAVTLGPGTGREREEKVAMMALRATLEFRAANDRAHAFDAFGDVALVEGSQ